MPDLTWTYNIGGELRSGGLGSTFAHLPVRTAAALPVSFARAEWIFFAMHDTRATGEI